MHPQMPETPSYALALVPFAAPITPNRRLLLYALRRMGAHGLHDAHAANAMLGTFGLSYRRPLIMLRAFLTETSRISHRRISITGCCCPRMTMDEARLIEAISTSDADMRGAALLLRQILATESLSALGAAQGIGAAFADLGRPLELD
jgi:hypothetical protein